MNKYVCFKDHYQKDLEKLKAEMTKK